MPDDALPQPWPSIPEGTVVFRREYLDVLGRPMTGTATITGTLRTEKDGVVTLPASVMVRIENGLLEVDLPPDTYTVDADLRTVDRVRETDHIEFTL